MLLAAAACACAAASGPAPGAPARYQPDRRDYGAFRAGHPEILDPNYLPFMVHRKPSRDRVGDLLVFCRWEESDMPLRVYVEPPRIPEPMQKEFGPRREPSQYVAAVESALRRWEGELEGLVRFERVEDEREALLSLVLVGEQAPVPEADVEVLGLTSLASACRIGEHDPGEDRVSVRFQVPPVRLYVADRFGLLVPDQVEWVALHEIGHALGMKGHSPIPADLMYEVVRDRVIVRELSEQDVNSFVSLYRIPNGAVFGRAPLAGAGARPPPPLPAGAPELELAPPVDARRGFSIRLPAGWLKVETALGMVAVDGTTWDYTASFQVIVHAYPTVEAYLERYGPHYLHRGRVVEVGPAEVADKRALHFVLEDPSGDFADLITFVETGDGRVVVVLADCPTAACEAYRPWFEASLRSLRIWPGEAAR